MLRLGTANESSQKGSKAGFSPFPSGKYDKAMALRQAGINRLK